MNAHGIVFLGRTRPVANRSASGAFQLTLLAMDRIGTHQVEPWRITWAGEEAHSFWEHHQDKLVPGQPLHVQINRIQPMSQRHCAPEIHAQAQCIELARRSTDGRVTHSETIEAAQA